MSIERKTVVTAADFRNSAVIAEELLLDVAFVLDDGWPIGPRALYALGSLFEAIALHENIYFDPLGRYGPEPSSKRSTIETLLTGSEFIRTLVSHGCLKPFPARLAVEEFCASPENTAGLTFDLIDFLTDATWTGHSFADAAPESELNNYRILADLTAHVPEIFYHESLDIKRLVDLGEGAAVYALPPAESTIALRLGFSNDDLVLIGSLNRRSRAFQTLAGGLGLNFYHVFQGLPYQLGAIEVCNGHARTLFDKLVQHATRHDEAEPDAKPGATAYDRIPIPALLGAALEKCKGDAQALADIAALLRFQTAAFRTSMTTFEAAWQSKTTRKEHLELKTELEAAQKRIAELGAKPATRMIYHVWDVLKAPAKAPSVLLEKAAGLVMGPDIIGRIRGLHDFYDLLTASPLPTHSHAALRKVFPKIHEPEVWSHGRDLAAYLAKRTAPPETTAAPALPSGASSL